MANETTQDWIVPEAPDVSKLVTEDGAPVDNIGSEKQQRLLSEVLYSSWRTPGQLDFFAAANVGIYNSPNQPPVVPDLFISLEVKAPKDFWLKKNRCYLLWEFEKAPEFVLEIVSDRDGPELSAKVRRYARMGILYYVVYDPALSISDQLLQAFVLRDGHYVPLESPRFPALELGLCFHEGTFEGTTTQWLRFTDLQNNLLLTGDERAEQEKTRAEQEKTRAEQEKTRAEQEKTRAEQERLRANEEHARAEQEKTRAEQEHSRAEQERLRANEERSRADEEQRKAEQERLRAQRLAEKLRALGLDPDE